MQSGGKYQPDIDGTDFLVIIGVFILKRYYQIHTKCTVNSNIASILISHWNLMF